MFYALSDFFSPVSLRALAAFFTALLIALACGSRLIEFLHHHQSKGQPIREDGPQSHLLTKKGTPTMGGLLILGSCIFSTLLWADLNNYFIWISLLVLLIYGTTGFVDDYVKVTKQTANAMTARMKLVLQFSTALIASAVISYATPEAYRYSLTIPYFRDLALNLCWFYIPFAMIVIAGASNAVNLSDGLDGLASGLLICSFAVFMLIAYTCGTAVAPHFTGFVDDYVKVTKQTANAMTARMKLVLQFSTALIASAVISYATPEAYRYSLTIPYFRDLALNLCWFYIPFAMIVIAGASNAVNLSDGLDGLASGLLICSFAVFMLIAYTCGTAVAPHFTAFVIPAAGEITVLCAAVIGCCLGFLWFNAPKAKVFMGDTGSLALGALLGTVAVMTKHEILLAIVGGVFVMETVSVMIQVAYFKKTGGKRFFKMAPVHHHFEQLGWPETTVVIRFWIMAFILAVLGLASLLTL